MRHPVRLLLLAAFVATASACTYFPLALEHFEAHPETRPWFCHPAELDGGHGHGGHGGPTEPEMLSWDDCKALAAQFDLALEWAMQWPTVGDAEAAGFHALVPYVAGMGTHHAPRGGFDRDDWAAIDPEDPRFPGTALDDRFQPTRPEFLQYGGNGPDAPLVGMSWYVRTDDGHPPEGFRGHNDRWHTHELLCFSDDARFRGENLSDATCEARGGRNFHLGDYYMVHAWIVPGTTHEANVFVNHHPCLRWGGPAPADDPCWGDDHGAHDTHG